eukprot:TRINITY_DN24195_c0_g1_i1.p1 TRINITY_DN24195_c0_g1~~TRINITY_DN24195_c0_g1_i1.p1  ORF type:complete len:235 (-),score=38.17 TRINITY_DN24195_c0_g1_i1:185-889(-)
MPATGSDAQPKKRGNGGKRKKKTSTEAEEDDQDDDLTKMVITLQKSQLLTSHTVRQLVAHNWDFCMLPTTAAIVQAGEYVAKRYAEAIKEKGKGHGLGSPHVHVAAAVIEEMAQPKANPTNPDMVVQSLHQVFQERGPELVNEIFTHFRVKEAYTPEGTEAMTKSNISRQPTSNTGRGKRRPPSRHHSECNARSLADSDRRARRSSKHTERCLAERTVQRQLRQLQIKHGCDRC